MLEKGKILVYGYGNPGRQDDGLGVALISRLEQWITESNLQHIDADTNYQLNIEDAAAIHPYDEVVFVDASMEDIHDFDFSEVKPDNARVEFTMHAVSPAFVIDLCRKIYGKSPKARLLHIKGYEWEFEEQLSPPARDNLNKAFEFLINYLMTNE